MLGERYVVKSGDNLWDIAKTKLGDGSQWPRIYRYNNRAEVIKSTGRGIPDPDTLHPGQTLLLPVLPGAENGRGGRVATISPAPARAPQSQPRTLSRDLHRAKSPIVLKFHLNDFVFPPIVQPNVIIEVKMSGDIVLATKESYPVSINVNQNREIEAKVVRQANLALNALIGETSCTYDAKEKKLTYKSMLVTRSNLPNTAFTAIGAQVDSKSGMPKLVFEYNFPDLKGSINEFNYAAIEVKIVIEVTPKPGQVVKKDGLIERQVPQREIDWDKLIQGIGIVGTAAIIIVVIVLDDFIGFVWDDVVGFMAAVALWTRGILMIRGAVGLPQTASSAMVRLSMRFTTAKG